MVWDLRTTSSKSQLEPRVHQVNVGIGLLAGKLARTTSEHAMVQNCKSSSERLTSISEQSLKGDVVGVLIDLGKSLPPGIPNKTLR